MWNELRNWTAIIDALILYLWKCRVLISSAPVFMPSPGTVSEALWFRVVCPSVFTYVSHTPQGPQSESSISGQLVLYKRSDILRAQVNRSSINYYGNKHFDRKVLLFSMCISMCRHSRWTHHFFLLTFAHNLNSWHVYFSHYFLYPRQWLLNCFLN